MKLFKYSLFALALLYGNAAFSQTPAMRMPILKAVDYQLAVRLTKIY